MSRNGFGLIEALVATSLLAASTLVLSFLFQSYVNFSKYKVNRGAIEDLRRYTRSVFDCSKTLTAELATCSAVNGGYISARDLNNVTVMAKYPTPAYVSTGVAWRAFCHVETTDPQIYRLNVEFARGVDPYTSNFDRDPYTKKLYSWQRLFSQDIYCRTAGPPPPPPPVPTPCTTNDLTAPFFQRGLNYGGFCWYMTWVNQSCDTTCSTHGGVNAATINYAGSGGNWANCSNLGAAFEPLFVANGGTYILDSAIVQAAPVGLGCNLVAIPVLASHFMPAFGIPISYVTGPTTTAAAAASRSRFCACNL